MSNEIQSILRHRFVDFITTLTHTHALKYVAVSVCRKQSNRGGTVDKQFMPQLLHDTYLQTYIHTAILPDRVMPS